MAILEFLWGAFVFVVLVWLIARFLNFCSDLRAAVNEWRAMLSAQTQVYKIWIDEANNGN